MCTTVRITSSLSVRVLCQGTDNGATAAVSMTMTIAGSRSANIAYSCAASEDTSILLFS